MLKSILFIESNLGYWSTVNEHDSVSITIRSELAVSNNEANEVLPFSKTTYEPKKGDKIYFMPGVSIPRIKFKSLALEHGIKTVRNPEDANIFFANQNSIHKISTTVWNYKIPTEKFKAFITDSNLLSKLDNHDIDKLNTALEFYENEFIYCDRSLAKEIDDMLNNHLIIFISDDYKNMINATIGNQIFDESGVVDLLNGDEACIIDKTVYQQLQTMFDSTDIDNHVLAMEIMANCKYNSSLVYLLLLFKYNSSEIHQCHTKNHVNFKSLMNWVGEDLRYRNDIDSITNILKDKGQFTPDKLDIILDNCKEDIKDRGDSTFYKIKVITVNAEELANLNCNYVYNLEEDFVPLIPVIEEEVVFIGEDESPVIDIIDSDFAIEDDFDDVEILESLPVEEIVIEEVYVEPENDERNSLITENTKFINDDKSDIDWF